MSAVPTSQSFTGALIKALEVLVLAIVARVGWEVGGKLWALL